MHSASKAATAVGFRSKPTSKLQVTHSPQKYGKRYNSRADSHALCLSKHYLPQTPQFSTHFKVKYGKFDTNKCSDTL